MTEKRKTKGEFERRLASTINETYEIEEGIPEEGVINDGELKRLKIKIDKLNDLLQHHLKDKKEELEKARNFGKPLNNEILRWVRLRMIRRILVGIAIDKVFTRLEEKQ
jgi:hypothetical protein